MSIFTYTATRELAPGTGASELVTRDFRLTSFPKQRKAIVSQNTAMGGALESIRFRAEQVFSCETGLVDPMSIAEAYIEEFIASVENGELFTFDRYGTIAVPHDPKQCVMVSTTFSASEQGKKYHRYRFVIRAS